MESLNKTATKTFLKMLSMMTPGVPSLTINHAAGSFMAVHLELISDGVTLITNGSIYSLAHYYLQNGDLVPDPDMTFFVSVNREVIIPLSYRDSFGTREAIYKNNGQWYINKATAADHRSFASLWLRNIKFQQSL